MNEKPPTTSPESPEEPGASLGPQNEVTPSKPPERPREDIDRERRALYSSEELGIAKKLKRDAELLRRAQAEELGPTPPLNRPGRTSERVKEHGTRPPENLPVADTEPEDPGSTVASPETERETPLSPQERTFLAEKGYPDEVIEGDPEAARMRIEALGGIAHENEAEEGIEEEIKEESNPDTRGPNDTTEGAPERPETESESRSFSVVDMMPEKVAALYAQLEHNMHEDGIAARKALSSTYERAKLNLNDRAHVLFNSSIEDIHTWRSERVARRLMRSNQSVEQLESKVNAIDATLQQLEEKHGPVDETIRMRAGEERSFFARKLEKAKNKQGSIRARLEHIQRQKDQYERTRKEIARRAIEKIDAELRPYERGIVSAQGHKEQLDAEISNFQDIREKLSGRLDALEDEMERAGFAFEEQHIKQRMKEARTELRAATKEQIRRHNDRHDVESHLIRLEKKADTWRESRDTFARLSKRTTPNTRSVMRPREPEEPDYTPSESTRAPGAPKAHPRHETKSPEHPAVEEEVEGTRSEEGYAEDIRTAHEHTNLFKKLYGSEFSFSKGEFQKANKDVDMSTPMSFAQFTHCILRTHALIEHAGTDRRRRNLISHKQLVKKMRYLKKFARVTTHDS